MQKKVKRMNTGLIMMVFSSPFVVIPFFILQLQSYTQHDLFLIFVLSYCAVLFLCSVLFHYHMWAAIYDTWVDMHPFFATLLLHIPIVNIFWAFGFYRGFVENYNDNIQLYGLESKLKPINGSQFRALPVLFVISILTGWIALVDLLVGVITYFVFWLVVIETCTAVNRMSDALERETEGETDGEKKAKPYWA